MSAHLPQANLRFPAARRPWHDDAEDALDVAARCATMRRFVPAGREIYAQGEPCTDLYVVIDGWAVQHQILEDGRRQILNFALAGTVLGFVPAADDEMSHGAEAITDVTVAVITRARIEAIFYEDPRTALRLTAAALDGLNFAYELLTDIGRRTAREAVAHLLLRLTRRLGRAGVERTYALPLTQEHLGDALGLTAVHVCRTLRALREDGILCLARGRLAILDMRRLAEAAGTQCAPADVCAASAGPLQRRRLPETVRLAS